MIKLDSKKIGSILVLAILFGAIVAILPLQPVYASTGHPVLAAVNNLSSPTSITNATSNISVLAGSATVQKVDGASATGFLAIEFKANVTSLVTFSGSQFFLYFSKDGLSQISSGDLEYAGPFNVADLSSSYTVKSIAVNSSLFTNSTAQFGIGNVKIGPSYYQLVVGPIPLKIANNYKYIKIFDGSSTSVAVSAQSVIVLPNLAVTPTSGVANQTLKFVGGGFPANTMVNINATFTYTNWAGSLVPVSNIVVVSGISTGQGFFNATGRAPDTKAAVNPAPSHTSASQLSLTITFKAVNASATSTVFASTTFIEFTRVLNQVFDVPSSTPATGKLTPQTFYGNATAILPVHIFDSVIIAGGNFSATSTISITVGSSKFTTHTNATGFFNVTIQVPILPIGNNIVNINDNGVIYTLTFNVTPTLILKDTSTGTNSGHVGDTVQAIAYGFPANSAVYIYWGNVTFNLVKHVGNNDTRWLFNATTGPNGTFNITVTFNVPHTYGGSHKVFALNTYKGAPGNITPITSSIIISYAIFVVKPNFFLSFSLSSPQQNYPTISNNGQILSIVGNGLDPTVFYTVAVDNQYLVPGNSSVAGNGTGDMVMQFTAAGFRPGLHVIAFYVSPSQGKYLIAGQVLFWVSPAGDFVLSALNQINATIVAINSTVAMIKTSVGNISMSLSQVITMLNQINATIVSLNGNVATLHTAIGNLQASLSALNTTIVALNNNTVAIKTALGTIQGTITSVSNGVATIQTSLGTITTTLSSIQSGVSSAGSSAASANSNAANAANYSLYTLILVIITLIISIVAVVFSARRR